MSKPLATKVEYTPKCKCPNWAQLAIFSPVPAKVSGVNGGQGGQDHTAV